MTQTLTDTQVYALRIQNGNLIHMDIYEDKSIEEVTDILVADLTFDQFLSAGTIREENCEIVTINNEPMWIVLDSRGYNIFTENPEELN